MLGGTLVITGSITGSIGGTFAGLPEGGTKTALFAGTPYDFTASYAAGTGNDFVLTAVPEASGAVLALAGLGLLSLRRRR